MNNFLNSGETILVNYVGKISHVFVHKLDVALEPNIAFSIFLHCSLSFFLILIFLFLRGKIYVNISDTMLTFALDIPYGVSIFAS